MSSTRKCSIFQALKVLCSVSLFLVLDSGVIQGVYTVLLHKTAGFTVQEVKQYCYSLLIFNIFPGFECKSSTCNNLPPNQICWNIHHRPLGKATSYVDCRNNCVSFDYKIQ